MGANTGLIILIAFMIILILTIVIFGILIMRMKRLQMKFVMPDKTIAVKNLYGKVTREQTFLNGIYFIDDACMLKKFFGNEIWYYFGNPSPINFNFDKNLNNIIGTKAQDLKTFHDSDLIKKLFSTESMEKMLMLLMIANIILGIACIVVTMTTSGKPVTFANTQNNTDIIIRAVRIALTTPITPIG